MLLAVTIILSSFLGQTYSIYIIAESAIGLRLLVAYSRINEIIYVYRTYISASWTKEWCTHHYMYNYGCNSSSIL
jgi:hypothetical protein